MKNEYAIGLDVSTTNIGFGIFSTQTGKMIELKHLELKVSKDVSVEDRIIHKAIIFKEYIEDLNQHILNELKGKITHVFIEEPLGSSNNINTVGLLMAFNGIVSYILYQTFNIFPKKISVHDSRILVIRDMVKTSYKKGEKIETLSFPKGWKSAEKKNHIWKMMKKMFPEVSWFYMKDNETPKDTCYDMADALVVSISSLILLGIINKEDWEKKYLSTI